MSSEPKSKVTYSPTNDPVPAGAPLEWSNSIIPSGKIELLQIAVPYELAVPSIGYYFFFGGLYPA